MLNVKVSSERFAVQIFAPRVSTELADVNIWVAEVSDMKSITTIKIINTEISFPDFER